MKISQTQKDKCCQVLHVNAKNVDFPEGARIMATCGGEGWRVGTEKASGWLTGQGYSWMDTVCFVAQWGN